MGLNEVTEMKHDLRCTECGKLLGKAAKAFEAASYNHAIELKCGKCKAINKYKAK